MIRPVLWAALVLAAFPLAAFPLAASPWEGFTCLTLSSDARSFATGGRSGELVWWETSTGEVRGRWHLPTDSLVVAVAFGADDRTLAAAALDGTTWTVGTGDPAPVPLARVPPTLVDARKRWLASAPLARGVGLRGPGWTLRGAPDGTVTVRADGKDSLPLVLTGHQGVVTGLALGPGGTWFLSCAWDGSLVRWDLPSGRISGRL